MKNILALFIGFLLIAAALMLAMTGTTQDAGTRAVAARDLATEFHRTPTAPPTPTFTPTPTITPTATPLPRHVTTLQPTQDELLDLLFHYPLYGMTIGVKNARAVLSPIELSPGLRGLVVTGDRLEGGRGRQVGTGAFGALLVWENGEWIPRFSRIVWTHGYAETFFRDEGNGRLVFQFEPLVQPPDGQGWQRVSIVSPCGEAGAEPTTAPTPDALPAVEVRCY